MACPNCFNPFIVSLKSTEPKSIDFINNCIPLTINITSATNAPIIAIITATTIAICIIAGTIAHKPVAIACKPPAPASSVAPAPYPASPAVPTSIAPSFTVHTAPACLCNPPVVVVAPAVLSIAFISAETALVSKFILNKLAIALPKVDFPNCVFITVPKLIIYLFIPGIFNPTPYNVLNPAPTPAIDFVNIGTKPAKIPTAIPKPTMLDAPVCIGPGNCLKILEKVEKASFAVVNIGIIIDNNGVPIAPTKPSNSALALVLTPSNEFLYISFAFVPSPIAFTKTSNLWSCDNVPNISFASSSVVPIAFAKSVMLKPILANARFMILPFKTIF